MNGHRTCPKCSAPSSGDNCPRCGLALDKYNPAAIQMEVSESLRELFAKLESDWGNADLHNRFVMQCFAENAPAWAAACYRSRGDDPVAIKQLALISNRLVLTLQSSRVSSDACASSVRTPAMTLPILVFMLLLALGALALLLIPRQ